MNQFIFFKLDVLQEQQVPYKIEYIQNHSVVKILLNKYDWKRTFKAPRQACLEVPKYNYLLWNLLSVSICAKKFTFILIATNHSGVVNIDVSVK